MPEPTLRTVAGHARVARTVDATRAQPSELWADAASAGLDLASVTAALERDGVRSFCASYRRLLDTIERKRDALTPALA